METYAKQQPRSLSVTIYQGIKIFFQLILYLLITPLLAAAVSVLLNKILIVFNLPFLPITGLLAVICIWFAGYSGFSYMVNQKGIKKFIFLLYLGLSVSFLVPLNEYSVSLFLVSFFYFGGLSYNWLNEQNRKYY